MSTRGERIAAATRDPAVAPLADYAGVRRGFAWAEVRAQLGLVAGGAVNLGWLATDRHLGTARAARVALRCLGVDGSVREHTYAELAHASTRFANALRDAGVAPGATVFLYLGRVPELYVAALGALKHGCVVAPLFSAFGPEPLRTRLALGAAVVLVTTPALYERRVRAVRDSVPSLRHVYTVGSPGGAAPVGAVDFASVLAAADPAPRAPTTRADDAALLHFTSGTTGTPKGAVHVHEAALMHYATGRYALDLRDGDVYWCTADPGWVTGTSYGLLAPLLHGVTCVVDAGEFDPERWYSILESERVAVWYTAPTAIRMLMRAGPEVAGRHARPALRLVASVGEPLNPEAVWWGLDTLGLPILDNWWQTETGGIAIANTPGQDVKPGSMGRPLPGIEACIVRRVGDAHVERIVEPGVEGELALATPWPSMFRDYLGQTERYRRCFRDGLYLTGDLARRDADGYFWFVGRADDVIKSAGHLIGPFEVESVLLEHPAVAEAGVIGKPDPLVGEVVKAFVMPKPGHAPDEALRDSLLAHARRRLGASIAPKELQFVDSLPRTRSGKIMRRLLRARELGLPEGDLSTLESAS
jgi:acetyl-CoA synthetase